MNALIALVALTLSGSAEAARNDTYCHSTDIVDGGFVFVLNKDRTSAVLSEQTKAGPSPIAQMECEMLHVRAFPDALQNTVFCHAYNAGGGLVVRLYEGGFVYQRIAQVSETALLRDGVRETPAAHGELTCDRGF